MGLTAKSVGMNAARCDLVVEGTREGDKIIAFAGNPNVGKSTLFNRITGMNQHTGNWPGKTVCNAVGRCKKYNENLVFVDIPGTYSLMASSEEETVARDFICFGEPDAVVVVCDATCIERNLNLVLQTMEVSSRVIVCVNLLDEAEKKKIELNLKLLSKRLGVPVIGTVAKSGRGIKELIQTIEAVLGGLENSPFFVSYPKPLERAVSSLSSHLKNDAGLPNRWIALKLLEQDQTLIATLERYLNIDFSKAPYREALQQSFSDLAAEGIESQRIKDYIVSALVLTAETLCDEQVVHIKDSNYSRRDTRMDRFLTGKVTGPLVMLALLVFVLWLTISGANYPSDALWRFFNFLEPKLYTAVLSLGLPATLCNMLVGGVYRVVTWIISVMLPPMAIFFPLFTLLEDVGYLPRIAFNLDHSFKRCAACGKQALTTCMGFGCNAAGVTGCRIIDSPRERLIAILTNNFVPCNGRFPTLIAILTMFFTVGGFSGSLLSALLLTLLILLGLAATFICSKLLSCTLLKGQPSSFILELPPYRRPKIGSVIVRSIFDRTIFVLGRAISVAAPAGLLIWLLANIQVDGANLLTHCSNFLDPFGRLLGMDGVILLGFILGFPANEIVIPLIVMTYMQMGTLSDYGSLLALKDLLLQNGWTATTALCTLIFSLMHWPCSTTLLTVKKETGSLKWTLTAFLLPTLSGMLLCMIISAISHFF